MSNLIHTAHHLNPRLLLTAFSEEVEQQRHNSFHSDRTTPRNEYREIRRGLVGVVVQLERTKLPAARASGSRETDFTCGIYNEPLDSSDLRVERLLAGKPVRNDSRVGDTVYPNHAVSPKCKKHRANGALADVVSFSEAPRSWSFFKPRSLSKCANSLSVPDKRHSK